MPRVASFDILRPKRFRGLMQGEPGLYMFCMGDFPIFSRAFPRTWSCNRMKVSSSKAPCRFICDLHGQAGCYSFAGSFLTSQSPAFQSFPEGLSSMSQSATSLYRPARDRGSFSKGATPFSIDGVRVTTKVVTVAGPKHFESTAEN